MSQTQSRTATLVARELKKSYDGFEAVKGVDFEVHKGECFGFLGPNGAGKTTTMKMIYGAVIPREGELEVAGLDVRRCERDQTPHRGGAAGEQPGRRPQGRENLLVYGRYYDLPRKVALQRAEELLDFVELTEKAESQVDQLSGGMKRRLLIARALINDPEIVVLDEPTTGLTRRPGTWCGTGCARWRLRARPWSSRPTTWRRPPGCATGSLSWRTGSSSPRGHPRS